MHQKEKHISDVLIKDGKCTCPYCRKEYGGMPGLYQHMKFAHNKSAQNVYDEFLKEDGEGICPICGKSTLFRHGKYLITCSKERKEILHSRDIERAQKISKKLTKYTKEHFLEQAKLIHGNRFDYSQIELYDKNKEICIICPEHGKFMILPRDHLLYVKGGGCRKCTSESISKTKLNYSQEERENISQLPTT